jgi:hypothetical protein
VDWVHLDRTQARGLDSVVPDGTDVVVDDTCMTAAHAAQMRDLGDRIGSVVVLSTLSVYSDAAGRSLETAEDAYLARLG